MSFHCFVTFIPVGRPSARPARFRRKEVSGIPESANPCAQAWVSRHCRHPFPSDLLTIPSILITPFQTISGHLWHICSVIDHIRLFYGSKRDNSRKDTREKRRPHGNNEKSSPKKGAFGDKKRNVDILTVINAPSRNGWARLSRDKTVKNVSRKAWISTSQLPPKPCHEPEKITRQTRQIPKSSIRFMIRSKLDMFGLSATEPVAVDRLRKGCCCWG